MCTLSLCTLLLGVDQPRPWQNLQEISVRRAIKVEAAFHSFILHSKMYFPLSFFFELKAYFFYDVLAN